MGVLTRSSRARGAMKLTRVMVAFGLVLSLSALFVGSPVGTPVASAAASGPWFPTQYGRCVGGAFADGSSTESRPYVLCALDEVNFTYSTKGITGTLTNSTWNSTPQIGILDQADAANRLPNYQRECPMSSTYYVGPYTTAEFGAIPDGYFGVVGNASCSNGWMRSAPSTTFGATGAFGIVVPGTSGFNRGCHANASATVLTYETGCLHWYAWDGVQVGFGDQSWPVQYPANDPPPIDTSCVESGISITVDGVPYVDGEEVDFGATVAWSMDVPDGVSLEGLWWVYSRAATPLSYVGEAPYVIDGYLGTALPFPVEWNGSAATWDLIDATGAYGSSLMELVKTSVVGPVTASGSFIWVATSGQVLDHVGAFECRLDWDGRDLSGYPYGWEKVGASGSALLRNGCDLVRVAVLGDHREDDPYRFRVTLPLFGAATLVTAVTAVEARYDGGSWFVVEPSPSSGERVDVEFDRATYPDPLLVDVRAVCDLPGGGSGVREIESSVGQGSIDASGQGASQRSCYSEASNDLSLTSPKTWVIALGKMGVCLARFIVVPGDGVLSAWAEEQVTVLEDLPPFSLLFLAIGQTQDVAAAAESGSSSCFGGVPTPYTTGESATCPGDVFDDPVHMPILAMLLTAGVAWYVLTDAYVTIARDQNAGRQ